MEELLTFNLHIESLLVVLTKEPLASGLRRVVDLLKVDLLQIENLAIKRLSASLIKTTMEN
jgi:ribosomal protein L4